MQRSVRAISVFASHRRRQGLHSDALAARLHAYGSLLLEWNQRVNLTSRRRTAGDVHEDIRSILTVLPTLDRVAAAQSRSGARAGISLVDVGSGAGLPGLVIAAAR